MMTPTLTREEIDALVALERDGILTPDAIVAAAAHPDHPFHHRFTWNDSDAAQSWREHQARELIRIVRVEIKTETATILAPLYVHDPTAPGQCYRNVKAIARDDPDRAKAILRHTVSVARGHMERAQDLAAIFGLAAEVASVVRQMAQIEEHLAATVTASG